jgi:serine/threonine-protein kinase
MGTPDFMAPEQAQGRHVDHRADIYSLGASAYAMLTGRPPFVGKNEYDVIYKQLNNDPEPPSAVAMDADIPAWVDDVILRAMRKNPEERWATMRDFADAVREPPKPEAMLEKSSSGIGSTSVRKSAVRPGSARAGAKKSGLPMSPLVLVILFVGLAIASGLAVMLALK